MTRCPFCAEEIRAEAIKCKHCGEMLTAPLSKTTATTLPIRGRSESIQPSESANWLPYALLGLAVVYTLSPVDLVPDIPVVGWVDDFFVLASASLNALQSGFGRQNRLLEQILGVLKWGIIGLGAIVVLLIALVGAAIIKLFS